MKQFLLLVACCLLGISYFSQQPKPKALPSKIYHIMHDSTTSIDVVLFQSTNSISLDGKNVHIFNSFFEPQAATKTNIAQAGTIMWQIDGREYLSGKIFLGDSTGYVVTNFNGVEYVNQINSGGNQFFKNHVKK